MSRVGNTIPGIPDGPLGSTQQIDARYVIMPPRVNCAFKFIDYANMVRAGMVTPAGDPAIEGRELNNDEAQTYSASLQTLRQYIMGEISADPEPWPDGEGETAEPPEDVVIIKDLTPSDLADLMEVAKRRAMEKKDSASDLLNRLFPDPPERPNG